MSTVEVTLPDGQRLTAAITKASVQDLEVTGRRRRARDHQVDRGDDRQGGLTASGLRLCRSRAGGPDCPDDRGGHQHVHLAAVHLPRPRRHAAVASPTACCPTSRATATRCSAGTRTSHCGRRRWTRPAACCRPTSSTRSRPRDDAGRPGRRVGVRRTRPRRASRARRLAAPPRTAPTRPSASTRRPSPTLLGRGIITSLDDLTGRDWSALTGDRTRTHLIHRPGGHHARPHHPQRHHRRRLGPHRLPGRRRHPRRSPRQRRASPRRRRRPPGSSTPPARSSPPASSTRTPTTTPSCASTRTPTRRSSTASRASSPATAR